ncbi:MAG: ADP-ribosylglycohydrolase family protein [Opitutaceae bacterium]|nr:ADP-ribosylglycohydrolase family protein [Opitutaceae bacterium]
MQAIPITDRRQVTEGTEKEEFTEIGIRIRTISPQKLKAHKGPTNSSMPTLSDRFCGCILGGAVGDAFGSAYEGRTDLRHFSLASAHCGGITDDTQLTLATCEAIADANRIDPAVIAAAFLRWFQRGVLRGLGSSVMKSLRDLKSAHRGFGRRVR